MTSNQQQDAIVVKGARTHNLKNVDVSIPHNQLTVVCGPSGSGKSSLAIDTVFAEAQRQYIESLSYSSRQWLHQLPRADADEISGLPPAICISQHRGVSNPRSTVGTLTEIHDYLRVLMARVGTPSCPKCKRIIEQSSHEEIVQRLRALPERSKIMVLAPCRRAQGQSTRELVHAIRKMGQVRIHINGAVFDVDEFDDFDNDAAVIDSVIDRVIIKDGCESRLRDSLELAEKCAREFDAGGALAVSVLEPESDRNVWNTSRYSTRLECSNCEVTLDELEPRNFSFNSPYGSCEQCEGVGTIEQFDHQLMIFDWQKSIRSGAVRAWESLKHSDLESRISELSPILSELGIEPDQSLEQLKDDERELLLNGDDEYRWSVLQLVEKEWATCTDKRRLSELARFRSQLNCDRCQGGRLNRNAEAVTIGGLTIDQINRKSIKDTREYFELLQFEGIQFDIADPLLKEIQPRLNYLTRIGLGYLTLGRAADSLSGGEFQRARLASAAGTALTGVCYVLDEPSIGLHPSDTDRLIDVIKSLRNQENTVLVVEHDESIQASADQLIEMGPSAGPNGGQIVFSGSWTERKHERIFQTNPIEMLANEQETVFDATHSMQLIGASGNNLKNVDVSIPLNRLVCFSGVSGSGKSTLVNQTLVPAIQRLLGAYAVRPQPYRKLIGHERIAAVVSINQEPIGRSPRSNCATYTGIMDEIRKLFAATKLAKQLGFNATRFSFNGKTGACENCRGYGALKIPVSVIPDTWIECDSCNGARFNVPTLQVEFAGKTIADVLALDVDEAVEAFRNIEKVHSVVSKLQQVGLGYLKLGQAANTLSGGEAQRIRLALALSKQSENHTLFVFDEPTTGLHRVDIDRLIQSIREVIRAGNSVIVIEHNLQFIRNSDWIIDLGPGAGELGGQIVTCGSPNHVAEQENSITGRYLQESFEN